MAEASRCCRRRLSVQVLDGHDLYPPLYYRAPAPLFNWSAAQPRGPPTVS
jgi:hypothetical protein